MIAEKKKFSDHIDHKETTFQRSQWSFSLRSLESVFHMIAAVAERFFLNDHSDRSDHIENRL